MINTTPLVIVQANNLLSGIHEKRVIHHHKYATHCENGKELKGSQVVSEVSCYVDK
jgi:hypothetical protein